MFNCRKFILLLSFLCIPYSLFGFTVDLREPVYEEGKLKTELGGVITGPNLRIQAKHILYTKKENIEFIEAEEDVMVEFSGYVFVGKRIEYDLINKSGILFDGRTGVEPWFFGGAEIHLLSDGSYKIIQGFATTSENYFTEWELSSDEALLQNQRLLSAKNVYFKFIQLPVFWLPTLRLNLDSIFDSPIKYTVNFGGPQGPMIGFAYELFSWERWKAFGRLDYRSKRGFGGGFETYYNSLDGNQSLETVNYIANDITLYNGKPKTRYRYEGDYFGSFNGDRTTVELSWDKLSDKEMATDYSDHGIELDSAKRTQLHVRREEQNWITNFLTRVRVNKFQTVLQELPTLATNFRPIQIADTGIITENNFKLSYLELEYTNDTGSKDYNSPRYEFNYNFYRPYHLGNINLTPQIGGVSIYYGNNPDRKKRWMNIGYVGSEINTNFYRFYGDRKHVVTPYMKYQYYCFPSTSPTDHYIFDIDDGMYRLNLMRFGFDQSFYKKICNDCIYRDWYFDVWANVFFDTSSIEATIPLAYFKSIHNITPRLRQSLATAWDFREGILDHYNYLLEWTVSNNFAISSEYRHRSAFSWRKIDHNNFMLDSFLDIDELEPTQLSDRRDTVLLNFYYKFHPFWALQFYSRHGWNRKIQPDYHEFEIDLLGTIRSTWHITFSYRHREEEDRFSVNFSVGLKAPSRKDYECVIPCLEF
jgi:hypothetical protein